MRRIHSMAIVDHFLSRMHDIDPSHGFRHWRDGPWCICIALFHKVCIPMLVRRVFLSPAHVIRRQRADRNFRIRSYKACPDFHIRCSNTMGHYNLRSTSRERLARFPHQCYILPLILPLRSILRCDLQPRVLARLHWVGMQNAFRFHIIPHRGISCGTNYTLRERV